MIAGACLLFPLVWYGAFALAAPDSWWARRFYDEAKLARARTYSGRWANVFRE